MWGTELYMNARPGSQHLSWLEAGLPQLCDKKWPECSAVVGGHCQSSGGCCWGPASHKQGSKISLETALSACVVSVCLIKTG